MRRRPLAGHRAVTHRRAAAVLEAPRAAVARGDARASARARGAARPALRPARLPGGAQGPRGPPGPAARRAVTTTVVATVVAAPVLALWAAYRGAPLTGEGVTAAARSPRARRDGPAALDGEPVTAHYENAGNAPAPTRGHRLTASGDGRRTSRVRGHQPGHRRRALGDAATRAGLDRGGRSPAATRR